ncbi:hypothetical protein FACS189468_2040 [Spirochaetia bacterium]|nr:hypothetical protein FACS189468_2040 [Spirochaetia bacterium]
MKFLTLFRLAVQYLYRYRRRYLFLFLALAFGFSIVTFITSVKDGMAENVYFAAQSHYAGDIIATGRDHKNFDRLLNKENIDVVLKAAEKAGLNPARTVMRTNGFNKGVIYYNGAAVRLKYVNGVDWDTEAEYFSRLSYEIAPRQTPGDDGILLSAPVAQALGARQGDSVILEVSTNTGQKNTGFFYCGGNY